MIHYKNVEKKAVGKRKYRIVFRYKKQVTDSSQSSVNIKLRLYCSLYLISLQPSLCSLQAAAGERAGVGAALGRTWTADVMEDVQDMNVRRRRRREDDHGGKGVTSLINVTYSYGLWCPHLRRIVLHRIKVYKSYNRTLTDMESMNHCMLVCRIQNRHSRPAQIHR